MVRGLGVRMKFHTYLSQQLRKIWVGHGRPAGRLYSQATMALDRSAEFQRIVATRRAHQQAQHQISSSRPPSKRSEFAAAASQIGAGTALIADKLSKLTQLAQSQSLFEDPTIEINELTMIIKQDIQTINGQLASLQSAMAAAKADRAKQRASHSTSVMDSLKTRLMDATKEFQEVLHTRSNNMQLLQSRRNQFSFTPGGGACPATPGRASATLTPGSCTSAGGFGGASASRGLLPAPIFELGVAAPPPDFNGGGGALFGGGGSSADGGSGAGGNFGDGAVWASPAARPLGLPPRDGGGEVAIDMSGMQMQQQAMVPLNSTYYESRAQAVESVQTTIAELGNIFQQLGTMVQSHGEMIQRVDENVEESLANVTMGHEQLQLYWRNMQGNRGLMMKIFAVLFFFIVIWGTLFA